MSRTRILAIIQAGGAGGRLDVLTRERAKPALPFAGVYQLVDFPLSNLSHSGIDDVWLSVQFQSGTLEEQVANGRPWDLDRTIGGFRLLAPEEGGGSQHEQGFAAGNADELFRVRDQITSHDPELVIVCSADHVYRFDFAEAVRVHRAKSAECTVVTTEVPRAEASDHATVEANRLGRVTGFAYKPSRPSTGTVATEIFVYDTATLVEVLGELHRELFAEDAPDDTGLGDFGDHLLPRMVDRGRTYACPMDGYWRDLGQPEKYLAAHRDLLLRDVGLFDDPDWPILSMQPQRPPARVHDGAVVADSLISPGSEVRGTVRRSVVGPGVVVEAGATVSDSVLMTDARVGEGAAVDWTVMDTGCVVGPGARVGEPGAGEPDPDHLVLVGRDSRIESTVPAGARLEPGTTV
ncbi:MAG: glucose-1-phosphate adenylyltransferase family protein [Nocardioidaceae bacterium]